MASVSPVVTRTATTSPASLHMTNRWSPRVTSCTSPSLSENASRTKDEMAEIMLPTTSRSLSVIRVRDICLMRRPLEPMTKTSSIMGSGGATVATSMGGGGGGGRSAGLCDDAGFNVASSFVGTRFLTDGTRQRSEDAHANARPQPIGRYQPIRCPHTSLTVPRIEPENSRIFELTSLVAASGMAKAIVKMGYRIGAAAARKAMPAKMPRNFLHLETMPRAMPAAPAMRARVMKP